MIFTFPKPPVAAMKDTIFYSWQSDVDHSRWFIKKALDNAAKVVAKDDSLHVESVVDRAMKSASGALRIDHDILDRICQCAMFVGDVTLVTAVGADGRRSPNPNVLLELGFSIAKLEGYRRTILPFNNVYGSKHDLPFDLDKNRLLEFSLKEDATPSEKESTLGELTNDFSRAIREICKIPKLKDEAILFFNEVNPQILQLVRRGANRLIVWISTHRTERLTQIFDRPSAKEFATYQSTGGSMMGGERGTVNDNGVFDKFGTQLGQFVFEFKGAW